MRILVLSDNPRLAQHFRLRRQQGLVSEVVFAGYAELPRLLEAAERPALCYVDLGGADQRAVTRCLRTLAAREDCAYGLVDAGGKVEDVARVFHEGAVDYVDRAVLRQGVDLGRLRRVRAFLEGAQPSLLEQAAAKARDRRVTGYQLSGADWSGVVAGREYTFCMMFLELDGKEQMEKNYGARNLSRALASFRGWVENAVKPFGGRLWIWYSFGGLVLFPFSGDNCPALTCAFRMVLFKHFYDVEGSHFPGFLSLRLALHIGNTHYVEKDTGHVVSDGLNAIFHLGQQYAQPGGCYATEDVLRFAHGALRPYFVEAGVFEGRRILRMRRPLLQVDRRR